MGEILALCIALADLSNLSGSFVLPNGWESEEVAAQDVFVQAWSTQLIEYHGGDRIAARDDIFMAYVDLQGMDGAAARAQLAVCNAEPKE
ncbi:MAG: hypothetical protein ACPGID_01695 [Rubricella sp.]